MTEHDRKNLEFLLSIDSEALMRWLVQADSDDREYAFELLSRAASEIAVQEIEESEKKPIDLTQAKQILSRFQ